MKILMLTGKMDNGGAETHVYELARRLVRDGHGVTLVSSGGEYADRLASEGVICVTLPTDRVSVARLGVLHRYLKKALRRGSFDVVHAHTRLTSAVASAVCRRRRIPLVCTAHALFREKGLKSRAERWGNRAIAVSEDIALRLKSSGHIEENKISVIGNGIDTDAFCPLSGRVKNRVCFLSRLDRDSCDAAFALCRIADDLVARFQGLEIFIGGDGEMLSQIQGIADEVNARVGRRALRIVGRVVDVRGFVGRADVFVGVSRAALEAMSCGVPTVLAGNEGYLGAAIGETLKRAEKTNFCCRGEQRICDESLYRDVCGLLEMKKGERAEVSAKSREYVRLYHSADKMVEMIKKVYQMAVNESKTSVMLCGYYGFDNLGDDALLRSAIRRAREQYKDADVCAMTKNGAKDSDKFGVRCVGRYSPAVLSRELKSARVLVFGGGTLLQNSTSRRSLTYYLKILDMAKRKGVPTELWGNGIGNIRGRGCRRAVAKALSGCRYVGMRDGESASEAIGLLEENGYTSEKVKVEDDLALGTPSCSKSRVGQIFAELGLELDTPIAVIALRGMEKRGYLRIIGKHVATVVAEGLTPVYIVMFPAEDTKQTQRFLARSGGVVANGLDESEAVGLMSQASVVLAMRYHACVFAASAGTPFVGYGSESKVERFCRSHGGKYFTEII